MIESLGGAVQTSSRCCMVCNPTMFGSDSSLGIVEVGKAPPRKKRRMASSRRVTASQKELLESSLKLELEMYIAEHPNLAILGIQFVCPSSVINNIIMHSYIILL